MANNFDAISFAEKIFSNDFDFNEMALELFHFQYNHVIIYRQYCDALKINSAKIDHYTKIPFLPVSFFKSHQVICDEKKIEKIFTSSGTTGQQASQHLVADVSIYEKSFIKCFEEVYGPVHDYCFIALLPSYLEREGSSLVYMCDYMIGKTKHESSGFYLHDFEKLNNTIQQLKDTDTKTILLGVTYALLDFSEAFPQHMKDVIIMETGGMKGKRTEMVRSEVHTILKNAFHVNAIHSEYGMTEMLSQCYSTGDGKFTNPAHVKIILRDVNDPLEIKTNATRGGVNVIDLANIFSCAFIATQDLGKVYANNQFEVLGRFDYSDVRGCNLMLS